MHPTTAVAPQPRVQRRANPAGQHAGHAASITLRTMPALQGTGYTFRVLDEAGEVVASLVWREFATEYGWQCRLVGDRRTLRKCYSRITDALVEQGGFNRDAARAAVVANAEALEESA